MSSPGPTSNDADRLAALGCQKRRGQRQPEVRCRPSPFDPAQLDKFTQALQGRPVIVAGSTHPGEEALFAKIHADLKPTIPGLLTIIVPRHPHRGTQAANEVARYTKSVKRRGLGEMPVLGGNRHTDIYIADSLGELGLWYRLASVAVIGGSLVHHGGHNPLESLKLGIPTFTGPHMFNFQDMLPALTDAGLVTISPDVATLTRSLQKLLTTPDELTAMQTRITTQMPSLTGPSETASTRILTLIPSTF